MRHKYVLATSVVFIAACAFAAQDPHIAVGAEAPNFSGTGTDDKEHSLKGLTENGPAFVVFWKERCPHNKKASELINALQKAYGSKVKLVGFVNAPGDNAKTWVKQFGLEYPLLSDADKAVIKSYNLTYSITAFEIGKDRKITKVFPGYGKESMESLGKAMAAAYGADAPKVDLSGAPAGLTWG